MEDQEYPGSELHRVADFSSVEKEGLSVKINVMACHSGEKAYSSQNDLIPQLCDRTASLSLPIVPHPTTQFQSYRAYSPYAK